MKKIVIFIIFILTIIINTFLILAWNGEVNIDNNSKQAFNSTIVTDNTEKLKFLNNLNNDEISMLNDCIKNLSQVDIERIKQNLDNGNIEDVTAAFELMEKRLSDKEYNKVKQLFKQQLELNNIQI